MTLARKEKKIKRSVKTLHHNHKHGLGILLFVIETVSLRLSSYTLGYKSSIAFLKSLEPNLNYRLTTFDVVLNLQIR